MKCVKCHNNFVKNIFNNVLIDFCPSCELIFLNNMEEFKDVVFKSSKEQISSLVAKGYEEEREEKNKDDFFSCPHCCGALYLFKFKNLYVAKCNRCGGILISKEDLEYLINHRTIINSIVFNINLFIKWILNWKILRYIFKKN